MSSMKRNQVHPTKDSQTVPRVLIAALALALAFTSLAQAAPAQRRFTPKIRYELDSLYLGGGRLQRGKTIALCPGEMSYIAVYVFRVTDGRVSAIAGGTIRGALTDQSVATLSPHSPDLAAVQDMGSVVLRRAVFEVKALTPGETHILFKAETVGDEGLFPGRKLSAGVTQVKVRVDTCYEATQSAAGDEWPIKDVCSLKKPFVLHGKFFLQVFGGGSVKNDAKVMFFVPRRTPIPEGRYAYVAEQVYEAPDGTTFPGIQFGSGAYSLDVQPQEANITLTNEFTACLPGLCSVQLQDYKILLKPLPAGQECIGELQ